ncbi:MAG: chemotaxis protein CheV [Lachnospirales bacterium]
MDRYKNEFMIEDDTNEFSVMEFVINGKCYGINVAKVNIIMKYENVIPMPNASEYIEGVFKSREEIITVVNLPRFLNQEEKEDLSRDILVIVNLNKCLTAFHVHKVEGIRRILWSDIEKPDKSIYGTDESVVTGIARFQDRLITVLDFERILYDINPKAFSEDEPTYIYGEVEPEKPILVVEDSATPLKIIVDNLEKIGYKNIITKTTGTEAFKFLEESIERSGDIKDYVRCIISDIEMPLMDGLELTKKIRDNSKLKNLPVILFSSLLNDEMKRKCEESGATAYISKPEISNLVTLVNEYIL